MSAYSSTSDKQRSLSLAADDDDKNAADALIDFSKYTSEDALNIARTGDVELMSELVKSKGIKWLNGCRDDVTGWSCAHFAAATPIGFALLEWLYANKFDMSLRSRERHTWERDLTEIPAGSTCLHVAVARRQLQAAKFILSETISSAKLSTSRYESVMNFVNWRNQKDQKGLTAKEFVLLAVTRKKERDDFLAAFDEWEKEMKKLASGTTGMEIDAASSSAAAQPSASGARPMAIDAASPSAAAQPAASGTRTSARIVDLASKKKHKIYVHDENFAGTDNEDDKAIEHIPPFTPSTNVEGALRGIGKIKKVRIFLCAIAAISSLLNTRCLTIAA